MISKFLTSLVPVSLLTGTRSLKLTLTLRPWPVRIEEILRFSEAIPQASLTFNSFADKDLTIFTRRKGV